MYNRVRRLSTIRNRPYWVLLSLFSIQILLNTAAADSTTDAAVGQLVDARGRVESYSNTSTQWSNAVTGQLFQSKDALRTGDNGWAGLLLADETLIQLNRNSHLVLKETAASAGWLSRGVTPVAQVAQKSTYVLESGELWLRNKHRSGTIEINTATVAATIRGTEFNIRVDPDLVVTLTMLEGSVELVNQQGSLVAVSGDQVITRPGEAPRKTVLLSPQDAVQWTVSIPRLISTNDFPLRGSDRAALSSDLARIDRALSANPNNVGLMTERAEILRDLQRSEEARTLFEELRKRAPADGRIRTGLAWSLVDLGRHEEALPLFEGTKATRSTILGRSVALVGLGRFEQARGVVLEGLRLDPQYPAYVAQQATIDLELGRVSAARETLLKLTKSHPDFSLGWSMLALTEVMLGNNEAALAASQAATKVAAPSATTFVVDSYVAQASLDFNQARSSISRALDQNPSDVLALVNLAKLQFGAGETDLAFETIRKAEQISPDDAEVQNVLGFLYLAKRESSEARQAFMSAIKSNPSIGEPHMGLGLVNMREGDVPAALQEISRAVLLEPRRSLFLSYWGKMLYEVKRFPQALELLDAAAKLDPRDPTPALYSAIILRDLNRPSEAIRMLNHSIALNNNRAVYRSSLLLDQDLAVKNINLSIIYSQLGLDAWARNKAQASVRDDYSNYAGHIFLSGSLFGDEDRGTAAGNENLIGRLFQPANINSFNSFNEYTPFFEKPDMNATLSSSFGNNDTTSQNASVFGAIPEANAAFAASIFYDETDGWRDTNSERSHSVIGQAKWDITPDDQLTFSATHFNSETNDNIIPRFEVDDPADPFENGEDRTSRFELGYHHAFSPDSHLLVYNSYVGRDSDVLFHSDFTDPVIGDSFTDIDRRIPFFTSQAALHHQQGNHHLVAGTFQYWGKDRAIVEERITVEIDGETVPLEALDTSRTDKQEPSVHSYYIQDIWQLDQNWTVDAALYYDELNTGNAFTGFDLQSNEWGPRLGIIFTPNERDTLRIASYRYLVPLIATRIDPTDIGGFTVYRDNQVGTVSEETNVGWDREWSSGFFSLTGFYLDRTLDSATRGVEGERIDFTEHGRVFGNELVVNQIVATGLGFAAKLKYYDVETGFNRSNDREDYITAAGLQYVSETGFTAGISETYRFEDFKSERSDEHIFLTDVAVGYQFPDKRGAVSFGISNLFDREFNWVTDPFVFVGRTPDRTFLASITLNL